MTKSEAKRYLYRVKDAIRSELRILDQIRRLRDRQLSVTRPISGMPRGSTAYSLADYAADLDDLMQKLELERCNLVVAYKEVLQILDQLDGVERDIMVMHYLMMLTWEEIAFRIERSYRWTQKLHSRALEKVAEILS